MLGNPEDVLSCQNLPGNKSSSNLDLNFNPNASLFLSPDKPSFLSKINSNDQNSIKKILQLNLKLKYIQDSVIYLDSLEKQAYPILAELLMSKSKLEVIEVMDWLVVAKKYDISVANVICIFYFYRTEQRECYI